MASQAPKIERSITDRLKFLTEFVRSPLEVGSPIATFSGTIERLLSDIDWSKVRCCLEYGPGTGEFTRYILAHLPEDAQLIAIESEESLADHLRETIADNRLTVYKRSATETPALLGQDAGGKVDYILSGIPFSSLPAEDRDSILQDTTKLLRPDGVFLAYQVRRSIEPHLDKHFKDVRRQRVWLNLPPYHLYWCSGAARF